MKIPEKSETSFEEHGGFYHFENLEVLPYNHWRKDFAWVVVVIDRPAQIAFIPVNALTPREACSKAVALYLDKEEEDE